MAVEGTADSNLSPDITTTPAPDATTEEPAKSKKRKQPISLRETESQKKQRTLEDSADTTEKKTTEDAPEVQVKKEGVTGPNISDLPALKLRELSWETDILFAEINPCDDSRILGNYHVSLLTS